MQQHSSNTCRWSIRLSVEAMFGFIRNVFMSFVNLYRVCVTNEHWYVWFVLIAGHFICLGSSWLVTMCDIWPVVGVSRMMNAIFGTGPYLQSWIVLSNSSFNGAPFAQNLVSNEEYGPLLAFCPLSLSLTFVLRYVGSGYTNVVFRLSLCLLSLNLDCI